jgi:hypothetical protein
MRWSWLVVLALCAPALLTAQTDSLGARVEGRILDPVGTPLPQTEIIWQTDRRSVLSRADGSFTLAVPVRGQTVILVRRLGYDAQILRVDLSEGRWRGTIVLQPGSLRLPDVVVDAKYAKPAEYAGTTRFDDFFQRKKLGLGTFISREQIEEMNVIHTHEILRGVPGVWVRGPAGTPDRLGVRFVRCSGAGSKVNVWIDGQLQMPQAPPSRNEERVEGQDVAEILSRITASGVEMVEVYRGASQIPGPFHWDGCAAIVIWTQYHRLPDTDSVATGRQPPP